MIRIRTALALGIGNIFHVLSYRLRLALGIHPVQDVKATSPQPPFFIAPLNLRRGLEPAPRPDELPDWHADTRQDARPWWQITDFGTHDIKTVWQPSRFEWAVAWAQHAALGDTEAVERLNAWIADWLQHNAPYLGVNWQCGQEASIRVINLALASHLQQQTDTPCPSLQDLVALHLRRIAATRHYAIAQDNNHGITEAAALFIGGSFASAHENWAWIGRTQLEERVRTLVMPDGTFSLYSVNYHRMVLDTLVFVEVWRAARQLPQFSAQFYDRVSAMTWWLHAMIDANTGDAPNLGANDGTCLLKLGVIEDRDYRPSLQRAAALFLQRNATYGADPHQSLAWLGITLPQENLIPATSQSFSDGGFTIARRGNAMAVLHYPHFKFRPSQADLLHLDFWHKGQNILRDAGSFSYADPQANAYFSGIESHNSVQFDGQEPMPRLGRFLFGDWSKTDHIESLNANATTTSFGASYTSSHGAHHARTVHLKETSLHVEDNIANFQHKAVLRWRLPAGDWQLQGSTVTGHGYRLTVQANAPIARIALVSGWESRYYLQRSLLPVLEVELHEPATLTTQLQWHT